MNEDLIVGSAIRGVAGTPPSASALATTFIQSPVATSSARGSVAVPVAVKSR